MTTFMPKWLRTNFSQFGIACKHRPGQAISQTRFKQYTGIKYTEPKVTLVANLLEPNRFWFGLGKLEPKHKHMAMFLALKFTTTNAQTIITGNLTESLSQTQFVAFRQKKLPNTRTYCGNSSQ